MFFILVYVFNLGGQVNFNNIQIVEHIYFYHFLYRIVLYITKIRLIYTDYEPNAICTQTTFDQFFFLFRFYFRAFSSLWFIQFGKNKV